MIEAGCYNCNSTDDVPYAAENGFNLVKCGGCGLLYVSPRPSDEEIDAGVKIGAHRGDRVLEVTGRYIATKVALYRKILPAIYGRELQHRTTTWLDIGCGHGELLVALRQLYGNDVDATGIEPNGLKADAAQARGFRVGYWDLTTHDKTYDVISLLNVYSHLPNPRKFIHLLKQRLAPGGEILLETGDTADFPADQHPRPFLLPDHLSFTSANILSRMLKDAGFEIISMHKYPSIKLRFLLYVIPREVVKLMLPKKRSEFRSLWSWVRLSRYRADMWIRARLPNERPVGTSATGHGR